MLRCAAIIVGSLLAANSYAQDSAALATETDKLSYALGVDIGTDLREGSVEISPELLMKGLRDALSGGQTQMSVQEVETVVTDLRKELRRKLAMAAKNAAEENRRKETEFLSANGKQPDVVTLKNGLQYKILTKGYGRKPALDDRVVVHYRGTLLDGTEFDNSYKRNQPATFMVKQVIRGWRDALQLMPVGSKWQLFVPASLAYGVRGSGSKIGPNAMLIFEVELIDIKEKVVAQNDGGASGGGAAGDQQRTDLSRLIISFKLDPRLIGGTYAQPGWLSPQTYQGINGQDTVDARVDALDIAGGAVTGLKAEWIPDDPDKVAISPGQGNAVKIRILDKGETNVRVVYGKLSKTLSIKASAKDNILQVEITQL
jgi:FKBP-type peptidyl-prolyl cis-trans isomerase